MVKCKKSIHSEIVLEWCKEFGGSFMVLLNQSKHTSVKSSMSCMNSIQWESQHSITFLSSLIAVFHVLVWEPFCY